MRAAPLCLSLISPMSPAGGSARPTGVHQGSSLLLANPIEAVCSAQGCPHSALSVDATFLLQGLMSIYPDVLSAADQLMRCSAFAMHIT